MSLRAGLMALVMMGMAGCASTEDVAVSTGADTAGACDPTLYDAWFKATYRPALAAAVTTPTDAAFGALATAGTSKPCSSGDPAYLEYFGAWRSVWSSNQTRRSSVATSLLNATADTAPGLVTQLALTPSEDQLASALVAGAPTEGGLRSYAAWLETYASEFDSAVDAIVGGGIGTPFLVEPRATINPSENELLARVEAIRPQTTEAKSMSPWVDAYGGALAKAIDPSATTLDDATHAALARFVAAQPASNDDIDYQAYFEAYSGVLDGLGASPSAQSLVRLGAWEMAKPAAGGDTAYGVWLEAIGQRMSSVADSSSSTDEAEANLEVASLLKVKPCSGPASAAKFAPIAGRIAQVPALAALAVSAAPAVCAP